MPIAAPSIISTCSLPPDAVALEQPASLSRLERFFSILVEEEAPRCSKVAEASRTHLAALVEADAGNLSWIRAPSSHRDHRDYSSAPLASLVRDPPRHRKWTVSLMRAGCGQLPPHPSLRAYPRSPTRESGGARLTHLAKSAPPWPAVL
eukprot:scaffold26193_cov32-Tisochrysis_lutea.AAC.1